MYLFAVVFLSTRAELSVFQYLAGNPNEVRLLSLSLALGFRGRVRQKFDFCFSGENNGR